VRVARIGSRHICGDEAEQVLKVIMKVDQPRGKGAYVDHSSYDWAAALDRDFRASHRRALLWCVILSA
jgi:hypothetical protein